jgi:CPA1 family monovalent cation:H+ antiporter
LAAALSIPRVTAAGQPLAGRDLVLVLAVVVIAISLIVQGFTLSALVGRSGLALPGSRVIDEAKAARQQVARAAMLYLDELADSEAVAPHLIERVRQHLQTRVDLADPAASDEGAAASAYTALRREVVAVQSAELSRMYDDHRISDAAFHHLQRQLDLEDARLHEG